MQLLPCSTVQSVAVPLRQSVSVVVGFLVVFPPDIPNTEAGVYFKYMTP